jgi:type II secretion system protein H
VTKTQSGYTLIEILIVILIVSIVAAVALLTTSYNQNKQIQTLSEEIANLLSLVSEEAMLRPATIGLAFTPTTFDFYLYQENSEHKLVWQPIAKSPLNLHHYSKSIKITIKIHGKVMSLNGKPQIIITPSGDSATFTILFGDKNGRPRYQVIEYLDGTIKSEPYHEK